MDDASPKKSEHRSEVPKPPWALTSLLREKPSSGDWGYFGSGTPVACNEQELAEKARKSGAESILLVWTPNHPLVQTVYEIPQIASSVAARLKKELWNRIGASLILFPLLGVIAVLVREDPRQREFWILILAIFVLIPIVDAALGLVRLRRQLPAVLAAENEMIRFSLWESRMPRWLTNRGMWLLIGVYVIQHVTGIQDSAAKAGLVKSAVREGDWTRLLTGVFLHAASPLHIWFNVMAWRVAGKTVESLMGWWTLAPLFLVSALCGSLTSLWWLPRGTSIGASGGICGVIGCILVLGIRFRHQLPKGFARGIWGSVAYTVGMGLAAPNVIDNGAHLGGLVGGIAFGGFWISSKQKCLPMSSNPLRRGIATAALALLGAFAGVAVIRLFQGR